MCEMLGMGMMMFKTVFKKLLVTYLALIVLVIAALSVVFSILYSQYVFEEKHKLLLGAAANVNQMANELENKSMTTEELGNALDSLGYVTDSKIYVVRLDKQTLSEPDTVKLGEELKDSFLIEDLKKILDGKTTFHKKQYSNNFDMYTVFTGVPWKTDSGIKGAILLFSPVSHIADNIARINLAIWSVSIFFILLSAIFIYISSLKISRPIKQMEHAAVKLAEGENTEDLHIEGRDEIGNLARTFNYMKQQLVNTERMRREFIANVSHDLRTPLTSIGGFVQGMLDGIVEPKDYGKYLQIIHEETGRLTRLTSDILQLAQIQSGSMKLNKENLNVRDVISAVTDSISALPDEKAISLSVSCKPDIFAYADRDRLKQILYNLISNSVKYSKEGGVILVTVREMPSEVQFSVKDDGIGIPEDELPFIFEKFYRVDKSRQASQQGTGLGLNIVKSLVELHGGRIWAESEIGKGTEMIFTLPVM